MSRAIVITVKTVYGVETVYPVCEDAKLFAAIAGTKTLTLDTLEKAKALGYELIIENHSKLAQALGA
tara:strand:- start:8058 stop:8258 length:201 start_codon:yes stop_codon:yes gene_type:complete